MFVVEFRFNSVDRTLQMPVLPRMGDIIDFFDFDDENIVLRVERVVHISRDGDWTYHCNCAVQSNWIE